jgi:hypothetical protein
MRVVNFICQNSKGNNIPTTNDIMNVLVEGGDTVAIEYIMVIQDPMIISHNHHWVKRCVSVNISKNFGSNLAELGRKF